MNTVSSRSCWPCSKRCGLDRYCPCWSAPHHRATIDSSSSRRCVCALDQACERQDRSMVHPLRHCPARESTTRPSTARPLYSLAHQRVPMRLLHRARHEQVIVALRAEIAKRLITCLDRLRLEVSKLSLSGTGRQLVIGTSFHPVRYHQLDSAHPAPPPRLASNLRVAIRPLFEGIRPRGHACHE
jgi:hypothetical protein